MWTYCLQLASVVGVALIVNIFWVRWGEARQRAREAAQRARELKHIAGWTCPRCSQPLVGESISYIAYGPPRQGPLVLTPEEPFLSDIIVTCPHCEYLQKYSPAGYPYKNLGCTLERRQEWKAEEEASVA